MGKIFGREPVLWLSLVAVIVKFVSAFWIHVSADQQAGINAAAAAVLGLLIALSTHDGVNAAILGFVQAIVALGVGFGLHLDADHQALLMSLATAVLAMFTRTQVTAPVSAAQAAKPLIKAHAQA
ncbi:hypothetical protein ACEZDB_26980 [Streptacidiphilus sp. N1-3]|uniref:Holin n=1 Tax=Streptacidiphilus alkalitolerans TaxID=3342712 RepID=A0ABV6X7V4_9ACTN